MSATLEIAVHKYMHGGDALSGALADVLPIDPAARTSARRHIVVPAGDKPQPAAVRVPAGRYLVQIELPSGDLLQRQVTVADGETQPVVIEDERSRHEWLGWSHLTSRALRLGARGLANASAWVQVRPCLLDGVEPWQNLASWQTIVKRAAPVPLPEAMADHQTVAIEMTDGPDRVLQRVLVERDRRLDLATIPVPWPVHGTLAPVIIAVPRDPEQSLSVSVKDPQLGSLIGFLANGAVPSAQRFLKEGSEPSCALLEAFKDKVDNPLAATLGAYVLVVSSRKLGDESWLYWLNNLAGLFTWLPDGAVLKAWVSWRLADSAAARAHALEGFSEAFTRGIPLCTPIFRLLLDGLGAHAAVSHAYDAPGQLAAVRSAALRLDLTQPFTTFRFDIDEENP